MAFAMAVEDYAAQKPLRPVIVRHADDKGDLDAAEGQAVRLVTLNHALALLGGTSAPDVIRLDRAGSLLLSPIGQRGQNDERSRDRHRTVAGATR